MGLGQEGGSGQEPNLRQDWMWNVTKNKKAASLELSKQLKKEWEEKVREKMRKPILRPCWLL